MGCVDGTATGVDGGDDELARAEGGTAIGMAVDAGSAAGIAETAATAAATTHPAMSTAASAPDNVRPTRMSMMVATARLRRRRHR